MASNYIKKILQADVYAVAEQTPLDEADRLSMRLGNNVLLKREDLQPVFSFKLRGAYNKINNLTAAEKRRGVVTASAGNHAQGVALAANKLGIRAVIVMGKNTPEIKLSAVRKLDAKIILYGDNYDEAADHAKSLTVSKGYTYVHPFDDAEVIAGQGTVAMELLRQHTGSLDVVFVPVGGGGLIGGISVYVKYLRPDVKVIGVEAEGSASMWAALKAGKRVKLPAEDLDGFADGTAVRQVGAENFKLAKKYIDEIIRVSTDEICAAIKDIFEDTRTICEPAGALSVAGLKQYVSREKVTGQTLIGVVSGANMNFDRLRHISERTEIGEQRECLLSVTIPEQAGSFRKFCRAIGKRNITEFNYRYNTESKTGAQVLVGVQTQADSVDRLALLNQLKEKYPLVDLSDNEVAVLHIRHMVGGRASNLVDERLFRFEFPERPGALLRFLTVLGQGFNISMFHYRNHGAAYGRVLVGIQIPDQSLARFMQDLQEIGYRYWEETDNPAYQLFLV
ncbi:MAG: threonine ammonia-lyase, biosynthetic [Pseudomonadales bacterium]|nr:threonine ammonia-lyase, biosynthetic [Pseudomonadales bacterium]